ncbi:16S rRNA (cytosine(1402)-N(4))-methyltransferase RsmH [Campylobacter sp. 7477a]|uniref:16S rRNA (cytosine(1402)-N(4))-methyltransferase RsmH n=1 Tax=Campylobacter sp. 7477a TaxID=2735741 RepID=UPI00301476F3|nr:16S rRNA (cytosine(1402)-N(4))-methyltransferase RsmH [Campylobacter sp. 7477a]
MQSPHVSVLLEEVLDVFKDTKGNFIDCTLGYGGHSSALLKANSNLNLIACDRDDEAIEFSKKKLSEFGERVRIYKSKFSELIQILDQNDKKNVKGLLADIGVSSLQLDKNDRGFSINSDTLDMRMNQSDGLSAYDVINSYNKEKLAEILYKYAELTNANFIAQKIIEARKTKAITSAKELASIVGTRPIKGRSVSPAILVCQAIRIEVNNELGELEMLLESIKNAKFNGCKVAIISFHSLEDRIVKNTFKEWAKECICPSFAIRCECGGNHALGKILTKKAITPSKEEIAVNSRSSCAKMRVFEFKG